MISGNKKRDSKMEEKKYNNYKLFEWFGVITAIIYSLFVALNRLGVLWVFVATYFSFIDRNMGFSKPA